MSSALGLKIKRAAQQEMINRNRRKLKPRRRIDLFPFFNGIVMTIMCLLVIIPVAIMIIQSVNVDLNKSVIDFIRKPNISWKAYSIIWDKNGIKTGLYVSICRVIVGTITGLFSCSLLAYVLSRKEFIFRKQLTLFVLIGGLIQPGLIPEFALYRSMHLDNSFAVYIIPRMVNYIYVFILREYMKNIPESYIESAKLEGYGYFGIYRKIISPMCRPIYAAVALFLASFHWNEWFDSMIYNRMTAQYTTLSYEAMKLMAAVYSHRGGCQPMGDSIPTIPTSVKRAMLILTIFPMIFIYPLFQRYFIYSVAPEAVRIRENHDDIYGNTRPEVKENQSKLYKIISKIACKIIGRKKKRAVITIGCVLFIALISAIVIINTKAESSEASFYNTAKKAEVKEMGIEPAPGSSYIDYNTMETVYRLRAFDGTDKEAEPVVNSYTKELLNDDLKYSINEIKAAFRGYVSSSNILGDRSKDTAYYYLGYDVGTKTLVYVFELDEDLRIEYKATDGSIYRIIYDSSKYKAWPRH